jgi:hypothetical protein
MRRLGFGASSTARRKSQRVVQAVIPKKTRRSGSIHSFAFRTGTFEACFFGEDGVDGSVEEVVVKGLGRGVMKRGRGNNDRDIAQPGHFGIRRMPSPDSRYLSKMGSRRGSEIYRCGSG